MKNTPLSIRIIYILTSIIYYIAIFASSLGLIIAIGLLFGLWGDDLQLHIEMPLKANFDEVGQLSFLGQNVKVQVVEAVGKFHFIDTPKFVARTVAIPMFMIFPMMFWLVYLFHRFIRNVSEGRIFVKSNFKLLRNLGIGLSILWLFMILYLNIMRFFILGEIKFNTIGFSTEGGNWHVVILIGAMFMLVLSHVFLKGLELQKENELTI